ncbi:MAG: hypothetical protein JW995_13615 [Melioribacteraceae bacterium]|nr:hypothetical protein [Melioribacteraceae bacterium]
MSLKIYNRNPAVLVFAALTILFINSCDGGLTPTESSAGVTGFGGKVVFMGDWPSDVKLTYIVLFKNELLSAADFNIINLKYVSELIPSGTSEFYFNTISSVSLGKVEAGEYAYLAVAQSNSETLNLTRSSWRVAGVYKDPGGLKPGGIIVPDGKFLDGINILCDFNNPPIQPPGQ